MKKILLEDILLKYERPNCYPLGMLYILGKENILRTKICISPESIRHFRQGVQVQYSCNAPWDSEQRGQSQAQRKGQGKTELSS